MLEEESKDETIKLISAEGHEFIIDRNAAMVSGTIKSMLSSPMGKKKLKKLLF